MRKLLNTLYITNENAYLSLDGENIVCRLDDDEKFRIPFDNVENIVCFSYIGCSPALMGKCVSKCIPINFHSPHGKFLAKVCGETKGNVFLRVAQIDVFRQNALNLAQNTMAAKFCNSVQTIKRTLHDVPALRDDEEIQNTISVLSDGAKKMLTADSVDQVIGIEGNCAQAYFSVFDKLITNKILHLVFLIAANALRLTRSMRFCRLCIRFIQTSLLPHWKPLDWIAISVIATLCIAEGARSPVIWSKKCAVWRIGLFSL